MRSTRFSFFIIISFIVCLLSACTTSDYAKKTGYARKAVKQRKHVYTPPPTAAQSELMMIAMSLLTVNYKYGGVTPDGCDCSGYVNYVFKEAWGQKLPRTAADISKFGKKVDNETLQQGDLVFYNTMRRPYSHVGIYIGDNQFVHSPSKGKKVRVEDMSQPYWQARFNGARRISAPKHFL